MANLFPFGTNFNNTIPIDTNSLSSKFGRSYKFDFTTGEFVLSPTGIIAQLKDIDAWIEWCKKALMTERYRYMAYSRKYGQEFDDLIPLYLSRSANESEIIRITTETLKANPRTANVGSFSFSWEGDTVTFTCTVTNIRGQTATTGRAVNV